jgi:hypothetical protein
MLKVIVEEEELPLEVVVETDIRAFEEYFKSLGNDPLVGPEKAILKTYLWWKTKGAQDGTKIGG